MTPICSYSELSLGKGLSVLAALRSVAIAGQLAFLAFASWGLMLPLPTVPMLVVISTLAVWNIAVYWRLKQPWEVTAAEAFLNLAVDIAGLSLLFYWSGGATNPFVSLFLIPIAFAAVILPYRYVAGVSLLCVVCYSLLMVFYIPLPAIDPQFGGDFNVHVLGMWVNFLISAVLMAVVVGGVAGSLRERERQLSKSREEALINERIVAMGALSAGISHEINTPLSTMTLVVDELMDRPGRIPRSIRTWIC